MNSLNVIGMNSIKAYVPIWFVPMWVPYGRDSSKLSLVGGGGGVKPSQGRSLFPDFDFLVPLGNLSLMSTLNVLCRWGKWKYGQGWATSVTCSFKVIHTVRPGRRREG